MAKRTPEQRWKDIVLERFVAFMRSEQKKALTREGLTVLQHLLGKRRKLTSWEYFSSSRERRTSSRYQAWRKKGQIVANQFGLAPWTIEMACLLKDYHPEHTGLVIEGSWPTIQVVTGCTNPEYLEKLSEPVAEAGFRVITEGNDCCTLGSSDQISTAHTAFRVTIGIPSGFPPEAAINLLKKALRVQNELLKRIGYPVKKRIRSSPFIRQAGKLKVGRPIERNEIYKIADAIYGVDETGQHDRQRRSTTKSRRNRLTQRLVSPYEHHESPESPCLDQTGASPDQPKTIGIC
ncbi:hypothetical protein DGWBC_0635 [Dehalogenimonas sp. WBC-2]|nr:hypothetical protein DGWBC_0635 [Dehalogenimonas sp. WBC-2]